MTDIGRPDISKIRTMPLSDPPRSLDSKTRDYLELLVRGIQRILREFSVEGIKAPLSSGTLIQGCPSTEPSSSLMGRNSVVFWVNESTNKLTIKVKYSTGSTKTSEITLT